MPKKASKELKRTIAQQLITGITVTELAHQHGYTYGGMLALTKSPDVQAELDHLRDHARGAAERAMFIFLLNGEAVAQDITARAFDRNDTKRWDAQKFIMQTILPQRTIQTNEYQGTVNVQIQQQELTQLTEQLARIGKTLQLPGRAGDPKDRLVAGKDAVPQADDTELDTESETPIIDIPQVSDDE